MQNHLPPERGFLSISHNAIFWDNNRPSWMYHTVESEYEVPKDYLFEASRIFVGCVRLRPMRRGIECSLSVYSDET